MAITRQWKSVSRMYDEVPYPFTGHSRLEAFWLTLSLNRYYSNHKGESFDIRQVPVRDNS